MRVAVWLALLTLSGAVIAPAQEISYDYDQSADFNAFRTYAWVRGTELDDELNHKRIVDALDAGLAAEGLSKVEATADPDLLVAYHARFGRDLEIQGFSSGWGPYRFGANRYGSARVDEILVGTLVVDMVDAETNDIVWRGTATKEIDTDASPEKREKNIRRAVEKILDKYPPER